MGRSLYILLFTILLAEISTAQIGGRYSFEFLNLTQSARTTALGGALISVIDGDATLAYANPAALNEKMHTELSINHNFHFADISHGFSNAAYHIGSLKTTAHIGVNYINYGEFVRADFLGNRDGTFRGGETAITIGAGRAINERMRVGVNAKLISSNLDIYRAMGLAFDAGFIYTNPDKQFSVGLVLKNMGTQLSSYTDQSEPLPFDLQLAYSKRFAHLPFRLSITAHQLHQWDIRLDEANADDPVIFLNQEQGETGPLAKSVDNFFRHFIFSGEFLIGPEEKFKIRLGYNHLRRKELAVSEFRSLGGVSFGVGFQVSKFRFDYGLGYYHLAGATNHLGFSINLSSFRNKI